MNEAETRAEHIDLALKAAGWGVVEGSRVLREHGITLAQYVKQGVDELDNEKLAPLLKLKYGAALSDAFEQLGRPDQVRGLFVSFQRHLYKPRSLEAPGA